ncbi:hypothetical protein L227DRAFT_580207 [Lentinus tigrinus ALCF2SS1-6]|uniref:DUF4139 domain-containing protein n=1 Tax=Lentinus tigrinus ALCF2SS1-6 TaxID=1328759 RepID=A0A5C2RT21_9APHY|nr:hypothetical protein L227DRAFT_580207 [Lentinus tigrinus ALCF2SS1-6]
MAASAISLHASDHPIKSVTIFHSDTGTAEITRTFPLSLRGEKNVVNIDGISSCIDLDSPRIRVLSGPSGVRVFDICCNIEELSAKCEALVAKRTLRQQEYDRLVETASRLHVSHGIAHSLIQNVSGFAKDSQDPPGSKAGHEVDQLMQTLVQQMRSASDALQTLDRQILELERELSVPLQSRKGDGSTVITVTILAEQECEVTLQLTYLVTGARWEPHYDLHAQTAGDGRPCADITLHHYAKITQSTGEEWKDTEITLSTSSSQSLTGLSIPSLDPRHVSPKQVNPPQARLLSSTHISTLAKAHPLTVTPGGFHLHAAGSGSNLQTRVPQPSKDTQAAPEDAYVHIPHPDTASHFIAPLTSTTQSLAHATVNSAPLSFVHNPAHSYRVGDGEAVSLPSDGLAHTVPLTTLRLRAEPEYVCVPRKSSAVFMQARIQNTGKHELLAGPVRVYLDDQFVAKTVLHHVAANESFVCILGVDTRLKVSYHQRSHPGSPQSATDVMKTTAYSTTITVTNDHDLDIAHLIVRDSLPVSDDDAKIKVSMQKPEDLAQAKDGEEMAVATNTNSEAKANVRVRWAKAEHGRGGREEGMYEWVCGLHAGAEIVLEAEWVVTAPA